ncbi:MAG: PIN domain-containing protein [Coriobacteriia bacterium]
MLVADANIWIDLDAAGLVETALGSSLGLQTTDLVLHELRQRELGSRLRLGGVIEHSLTPAQVSRVYDLRLEDVRPSIPDYSALVLADDLGVGLITGDGHLRKLATRAGVEVHGVLWVVDALVDEGILKPATAAAAIGAMIRAGSRLPAPEVTARVKRHRADPP